ncbi:MAG: Ldh family oxidoreductase [Pseudomonadota bacterium]
MSGRLSPAAAQALVCETLARARTSPENAAHVAEALVGAELAGQAGHGLRRLPSYAAQAAVGKIDGFAVPAATATRPGALSVDAAHGFAYPAMALAVERLPEMARAQGIALAGIRRSHHAGVTGLVAERLAETGLVALVFVNSPPAMAAWGGRRAVFGTNPIAFAAPLAEAAPVVIDLSLSKVARGKVLAAQQAGEAIPEDWALDADGQPTADPAAALAGTMVPAGDAKGAALALMVELLAAGLTGAHFAAEASSFLDAAGPPPGTGQAILAIDPGALSADAIARFGVLAAMVEGDGDARLPGRRRHALRARLSEEGIPLDPALAKEIEAIGRSG